MSIGSIGSTPSFWDQDQSFWQQAKANNNSLAATDAVINAMGAAETNLGKGLASIANAAALKRVNTQITSIVEQVLQSAGISTSSSSTGSSSSSNSTATSGSKAAASPATGTGTTVLTTGTSLSTLGILPGGTITVGTGANTTTYTSTGTDTIADLINAINVDLPTNANVTATLNLKGRLVITSRDNKSAIFIGGSGTDAAAIGFHSGNNTFLPKAASSSSASSASSSSAGTSTVPSKSSSTGSKSTAKSYATLASETAMGAESLLSASGLSGNLVNLLA